jgi:Fe-Mn family superoxide dismutase
MPFELPSLPYALNALEPHMSARTLEFHYGKHHKGYLDRLNSNLPGTPFEKATDLLELMAATHTDIVAHIKGEVENLKNATIYNSAAQVWNHTFFWDGMKPNGGAPTGELAKTIDKHFGDLATFKAKFKDAAANRFGSGWIWLVLTKDGKLEITSTLNAFTPHASGRKPLLTCDVWEHAYYLDYQNRRPDMVQTFLENLVNWDFVAKNLG